MKERTLSKSYEFEGKGLHTGASSKMKVSPAPAGTGIVFVRTDLGVTIPALAENVSNTARCTVISKGEAKISTIEHLMSAFTGLGIDNAIVEIDNVEVPILDGSARYYVEAFAADGLVEQDAERRYFDIPETIEVKHEATGSWVRIEPADHLSYDVTVDFGSRILGVQTAHWDETEDYASQVAVCRTFCFFHPGAGEGRRCRQCHRGGGASRGGCRPHPDGKSFRTTQTLRDSRGVSQQSRAELPGRMRPS